LPQVDFCEQARGALGDVVVQHIQVWQHQPQLGGSSSQVAALNV
jgi:hypothetical protein